MQVDRTFLQRHNLDAEGGLYKAVHWKYSNLRAADMSASCPFATPDIGDEGIAHNKIFTRGECPEIYRKVSSSDSVAACTSLCLHLSTPNFPILSPGGRVHQAKGGADDSWSDLETFTQDLNWQPDEEARASHACQRSLKEHASSDDKCVLFSPAARVRAIESQSYPSISSPTPLPALGPAQHHTRVLREIISHRQRGASCCTTRTSRRW
jgi:hypothetical protein